MAHTDVCKLEMCKEIDRRKKAAGGVRPAIRAVSKDYEIPMGTLKRWYYPEGSPKNGTHTRAKALAKRIKPTPGTRTAIRFRSEKGDGYLDVLTVYPGAKPGEVIPRFISGLQVDGKGYSIDKIFSVNGAGDPIPDRCLYAFIEGMGLDEYNMIDLATWPDE
jgi:hypothetical protein